MKVALVYDRVNKWGGAEKVLLALHKIFPDAPLYTSVYDRKKAPWADVFPKIVTSFLQRIPFMRDKHEFLGILTPIAFESFNFDDFDLVISVTSEAAKGIITKPKTRHVCYCLTPTRYLWSGYEEYLNNPPSNFSFIPFYKLISKPFLYYAKYWDKIASARPDEYISISTEVQKRIETYYSRMSKIIFPPVDVSRFKRNANALAYKKEDYYLFVSRLIPYKKTDIAIKAFNKLGIHLVIVGMGSEEKKLRRLASNNITFLNNASDEEVANLYVHARALVFPGEEDFGIVMVESLASGTPVIAYCKGGSGDIVVNQKTGILFNKQSVEGLISAIKSFEKKKFNNKILVNSTDRFSNEQFISEILKLT